MQRQPSRAWTHAHNLLFFYTCVLSRLNYPSLLATAITVRHARICNDDKAIGTHQAEHVQDPYLDAAHECSTVPHAVMTQMSSCGLAADQHSSERACLPGAQSGQVSAEGAQRAGTANDPSARRNGPPVRNDLADAPQDGSRNLSNVVQDASCERANASESQQHSSNRELHPFLVPIRRQHLPRTQPGTQLRPLRAEYAPVVNSDTADKLDLGAVVAPEARIGALYALYILYHTQPVTPWTRIYVTPDQLKALQDLTAVMKRRGIQDGLSMLRSMVADDAFIFGCVAVHRHDQSGVVDGHGVGRQGRAFARRNRDAAVSSVLEDAMRRAVIHLRQVVPEGLVGAALRDVHGSYERARLDVLQGDAQLQRSTIVPHDLADTVNAHYMDAVKDIHAALMPELHRKDAKHRRLSRQIGPAQSNAGPDGSVPELDWDLEAEVEAELQATMEGSTVGDDTSIDAADALMGLSGAAARVIRMAHERDRVKQQVGQSWLQYAAQQHASRQ